MKAEDFLWSIWRPQAVQGLFFFLMTKGDKYRNHSFQWPFRYSDLEAFFAKYDRQTYELHFCPHPFRRGYPIGRNATQGSVLWADLDKVRPDECIPEPHIAWSTSPGRYGALWRLENPTSPDTLVALNKQLNQSIGADCAWNLAHFLRLPGSLNHKYSDLPEVKITHNVTGAYQYSDFQSSYQDLLKKYKPVLSASIWKLLTTTEEVKKGSRSQVIWKLNNALYEASVPDEDIFTLLKQCKWNKFAGRDEQLRKEIRKCASLKKPTSTPDLVCAADVIPEDVTWIWYPYIARGKVTFIEGDPDLGKSFLTGKLCYHIANGVEFPESDDTIQGRVCLFNAEDGMEDTIVPRLIAMGVNRKHVFIKPYGSQFMIDEDGIKMMREHIQTHRPEMVIIDPFSAYIDPMKDMNKANDMRAVLMKLAVVAGENKVAVVIIRHITKSRNEVALYRGSGSIDISGAARSVIYVGAHPEERNQRVLVHIKSNLAPKGDSMVYELHPEKRNTFNWIGTCDLGVADLDANKHAGKRETKKSQAETLIRDELKRSNEVCIKHIKELCEDADISESTMKRASVKLNLKCRVTAKGNVWYR